MSFSLFIDSPTDAIGRLGVGPACFEHKVEDTPRCKLADHIRHNRLFSASIYVDNKKIAQPQLMSQIYFIIHGNCAFMIVDYSIHSRQGET